MALLSRKADYALLILSHLHHHAAPANARTISEKFSLSQPFTANILKELCRNGYVSSQRGVKGGYTLLPETRTVNLADLLFAIDEGLELTVCTSGKETSTACLLESVCPVRGPLMEIHRRIYDVFRNVTLDELFESNLKAMPSLLTLNIVGHQASESRKLAETNPDHPCI
jgi:Rrf2 family transcriptional regulator, cysteine metabolism repressor